MADPNALRDMEVIGMALSRIALVMEATYQLEVNRFEKDYPTRQRGKDATVTIVESEEDRRRIALGSEPGTSDEEWRGPRETEALKAAARRRGGIKTA